MKQFKKIIQVKRKIKKIKKVKVRRNKLKYENILSIFNFIFNFIYMVTLHIKLPH